MNNTLLNPANNCATITVDAAAFHRLLQRMDRLERYIMKRRELDIIELSHIEDEMGLERTKEKRNGAVHRA